ncbi:restriction endonuclease subunit S [Butyrivibrio sp. WCD3002]|uniref:restriction endonuclease subunit S n=1 Tax=Butyrivibrio sp. WCD3002 TaxID=1280676 RepID=UPI000407A357|nr:restriction endonuclease subunit S [Butyrivibrio sp. WCD3002]
MVKEKLSNLYDIGSSKRVFQSEWREEGVPFYRAREIARLSEDGYVDNELFIDEDLYEEYTERYGKPQPGDVMVTGVGTLGVCYVVKPGDEFYFKDGNILWFKQKAPDRILPEYLVKAFDSKEVKDFISKNSSGTTVGTFTIQTANKMEISLPPLDQQKEIIERISKLEVIIKKRQLELEMLDELIKARFVEMFGDPRINPFGYDTEEIGKTCKVITGNTPSRKVSEYYGDYMEWIKTDNIVSGVLNPTKAAECLSESGAEEGRIVDENSILMACIAGSIASIGRVCVTDRRVAFNQQINAIVPEQYNTLFLYTLLQISKDYLVEDINMALKGILSKSKLEEKVFIVPSMELQDQFAEFIEQVDTSKVAVQKALDETQTLFDSLMQEYFG